MLTYSLAVVILLRVPAPRVRLVVSDPGPPMRPLLVVCPLVHLGLLRLAVLMLSLVVMPS